jgi:TonB family protein
MVLAAYRPNNVSDETKILALLAAVAFHLLLLWWFTHARPLTPTEDDSALHWVEVSSVHQPPFPKISPKPIHSSDNAHVPRVHLPSGAAPRNPVNEGSLPTATGLNGTGSEGAGTGAANGGRDSAVRGIFHPPRVVRRARMDYPSDAFAAHQEGETEILVSIAADGTLTDAQVSKSSGNASLDAAALSTIRQYVFEAGTKGGVPIEAQAYVSLIWVINPAIVLDNRTNIPEEKRDHNARELKILSKQQ